MTESLSRNTIICMIVLIVSFLLILSCIFYCHYHKQVKVKEESFKVAVNSIKEIEAKEFKEFIWIDDYEYQSGEIYSGYILNNGQDQSYIIRAKCGVLRFPSGTKYRGSFHNNLPNGHGEFFYKDGTQYIGDFKNGLFHGFGKHVYINNDFYEGYYENGEIHGKGIYNYSNNGEQVEWEFNHGAPIIISSSTNPKINMTKNDIILPEIIENNNIYGNNNTDINSNNNNEIIMNLPPITQTALFHNNDNNQNNNDNINNNLNNNNSNTNIITNSSSNKYSSKRIIKTRDIEAFGYVPIDPSLLVKYKHTPYNNNHNNNTYNNNHNIINDNYISNDNNINSNNNLQKIEKQNYSSPNKNNNRRLILKAL